MSEREPNIEKDVINTIEEIWKQHPNLRLIQLIINAIPMSEPCSELYNIEDSKLIELLKKYNHK